jgi:hypothetical protein
MGDRMRCAEARFFDGIPSLRLDLVMKSRSPNERETELVWLAGANQSSTYF